MKRKERQHLCVSLCTCMCDAVSDEKRWEWKWNESEKKLYSRFWLKCNVISLFKRRGAVKMTTMLYYLLCCCGDGDGILTHLPYDWCAIHIRNLSLGTFLRRHRHCNAERQCICNRWNEKTKKILTICGIVVIDWMRLYLLLAIHTTSSIDI